MLLNIQYLHFARLSSLYDVPNACYVHYYESKFINSMLKCLHYTIMGETENYEFVNFKNNHRYVSEFLFSTA
jgi:hypothetical protein